MVRQPLFFCLLVFLSCNALSQDTTRGVIGIHTIDPVGENYALVVGISSYPNIKPLLYADDDAYLFAEYLVNEKICTKDNVYVLIDSQAKRAHFLAKLTWLRRTAKPNDRVFIYFAGHGDVEEEIEGGFLLPYDCEANNYTVTAIDLIQLQREVNAMVGKNVKVILITDACRSGLLTGGLSGASQTMKTLTVNFTNVIKLLSCGPTGFSDEHYYPGGGHGVFTYHLINGLCGMADIDNDSSIAVWEIRRYLDTVTIESKKKQNPLIFGESSSIIGKFNEKYLRIRTAQTAGDKKNTELAKNSGPRGRGLEDSIWESNIAYITFSKNIRKSQLIEPRGQNAYYTILEAEKKGQPVNLIEYMKLELSALLEDEAQKWISKYLRGELDIKSAVILRELKGVIKYLEIIKTLTEENDFRYLELQVKKTFFEAYFVWKKKDKSAYQPTINELEKALKSLPGQAWIYNLIGLLNSELRKFKEAESAYRNAIKFASSWAYPWNNLGFLYRDFRKYPQSDSAYRKAIQLDSFLAYPWNGLGGLYRLQKKYTKAEEAYKKAIEVNPEYAPPWYNLGSLYKLRKRYAESEKAYRKARQISSRF